MVKNKIHQVISGTVALTTVMLLFMLSTFSSCKKEDTKDRDIIVAADYALAENRFTEVKMICDEAGMPAAYSGGILTTAGVTVTYDTASTADPDTITINFGTTDLACNDDRIRRGKIIMNVSGHYRDSLSHTTVSFSGYFADGDMLSGGDTLINLGTDTASHLPQFRSLIHGNIFLASGGSVMWNTDKTLRQTAGSSTATIADDEYSVTGMGNGAQHTGLPFGAQISSPLIRARSCKYFIAGQVQVLPSGKSMRVIDAGSGACDDLANVTLEGETYTIHMK